jgi:hypothetical protein
VNLAAIIGLEDDTAAGAAGVAVSLASRDLFPLIVPVVAGARLAGPRGRSDAGRRGAGVLAAFIAHERLEWWAPTRSGKCTGFVRGTGGPGRTAGSMAFLLDGAVLQRGVAAIDDSALLGCGLNVRPIRCRGLLSQRVRDAQGARNANRTGDER